ncbi:MAG: LamG-like jellyroll fold domain-containing protein [Flavobacteriales bacterium]
MKGILVFFILLGCIGFSQFPTNGMIFNGTSNYYEVPDNSSIDLTGSLTIEAWINPCDTMGLHSIVTKLWCSGGEYAYYLHLRDGKLQWLWNPSGNCGGTLPFYESTLPIIRNNEWQHVGVVHTPTSVTLYYNGMPLAGTLVSGSYGGLINNSNQPLRVGSYRWNSGGIGGFFNGRMDEIRMWNRVRTNAQILSKYNSSLIGNEPGLQLYHNMESVTGSTITNSAVATGAANNGNGLGWTPNTTPNRSSYPFSFFLGSDTTICDSVSFNLNILNSYDSYLWNDGSTSNFKNITSSGTYIAYGYQDFCFTSDTISIVVNCDTLVDTVPYIEPCESYFVMPNVFSPNGDKVNDLFEPIQHSCYNLKRFLVVNRWGQTVFESSSKIEWDGNAQNGKNVKEGVYFWIIEYSNQRYKTNYEYGNVSVFK